MTAKTVLPAAFWHCRTSSVVLQAAVLKLLHKEERCLHRSTRSACCAASSDDKHKIVFLGTPEVAADVLGDLLKAASAPDSSFQVAAVVSQPGRPKGRGRKRIPQASPVTALAQSKGLPDRRIWCPSKANEEVFLNDLRSLSPDLCITAAYGNILPTKFLEIPRYGTLNIHPSLLPRYRGAAPVQRALQHGCEETGVSVAFTVRAMDAGPVVAQHRLKVDPDVQAPELLSRLFSSGTRLLLQHLDRVWSGKASEEAVPQDEAEVVHAAKLAKEEGALDFREPATTLHNKVRAFAGWPGTTATFSLEGEGTLSKAEPFKILRARVCHEASESLSTSRPSVIVEKQSLLVHCGLDASGGCLQILEIQPLGKKGMPVTAFLNGLNGRTLRLA